MKENTAINTTPTTEADINSMYFNKETQLYDYPASYIPESGETLLRVFAYGPLKDLGANDFIEVKQQNGVSFSYALRDVRITDVSEDLRVMISSDNSETRLHTNVLYLNGTFVYEDRSKRTREFWISDKSIIDFGSIAAPFELSLWKGCIKDAVLTWRGKKAFINEFGEVFDYRTRKKKLTSSAEETNPPKFDFELKITFVNANNDIVILRF